VVGIAALTTLTALGKPVPEVLSVVIAGALTGLLGLSVPGGSKAPPAALPGQADETGPADDVEPSIVEAAINAALPPAVGAVAPELAGNIAKEIGRVLRRGIKL
jgi:hypothetical protein